MLNAHMDDFNETTLGEALDRFLQKSGLREETAIQRLAAEWDQVVGSALAAQTAKITVGGGVVWLELNSPTWKNELLYNRERLRQRMNDYLGEELVKEVRIR